MNKRPIPVTATLLDAWQWMTDAETIEERAERGSQLLRSINREPVEPTEAMSRGTALNNAVDYELHRRIAAEAGVRKMKERPQTILEKADDREFVFDGQMVSAIADRIGFAIPQFYSEAIIATSFGEVVLYGYADYVFDEKITDLKAVSNYTIGKYANKWQQRVYPFTTVRSHTVEKVTEFEYLAVELHPVARGSEILTGTLCPEKYAVDIDRCERELRDVLESAFLPWIMEHESEITFPPMREAIWGEE